MKKLYILLSTVLMSTGVFAQTMGGPDAYGYIWRNSNDPQGPTFNWIDITTNGTQVTGLTDDNSVAFVPLGMNFHYYWADYNQLKIGSNGWLSFDNVSNIAHCFPRVPTAGGAGDNFLAPMMTDLIFNASGSSPECWYYYESSTQEFIVSYIDVPWWSANAPGYVGLNTFQIILARADSSITFQYLTTDPANFNDVVGCDADMEIGIENLTGNIGLEVYNEAMPANGEAIKFYYPGTVLLAVPDPAPVWSQNNMNEGTIYSASSAANFQAEVGNLGNTDVSTDIYAQLLIQDLIGTTVFSQTDTINGLVAGGTFALSYSVPPLTPGQYSVTLNTTNQDDINPSNNSLVTDMEVVDMTQPSFMMSYATQNPNMGTVSWTGGGGIGVHIVPPSYPVTLDSVTAWIANAGAPGDYLIEVFADDGTNGDPGTLLTSETMQAGTYPLDTWVTTVLTNPVNITSGGIYLAWSESIGTSTAIGTEMTGPISRQTYEFVGGSWAPYRENETTEVLMNGHFSGICGTLVANVLGTTDVSCNGMSDGAINIDVTGGTAPYTYMWDQGIGAVEDPSGLAAGTYMVSVTDSNNCLVAISVIINEPAALSLFATSQDEIFGNDGFIDLFVTGGTTPFTYQWDNGAGTVEDPTGLAGGVYTVIVTDANGCMDTLSVTVGSQVGMNDINPLANVSVYPNPNNGQFSIQANGLKETMQVEVLNAVGQVIETMQVNGNEVTPVNLADLGKGVYLLRFTAGEHQRVERLVLR